MMSIKRLILYLASVLLVQHATASFLGNSGKNIIDQFPLEGDALNKLCSDPNQRISKVSTITWLLEKFESLKGESLAQCKALYLEPLRVLNKVTSQYSDDACSLDKISWIDHFHWNYQMGAMNSKYMMISKGALPDPLKVFFLHYVSEISALCKANLPYNVRSACTQRDPSQDKAFLSADLGRVVESLQKVLIPFEEIKHYDDFILLWDMMVSHERKKNNDIVIVDPKSGEEYVAVVKVKDASKVWKAQQRCRQILKPIYKNTLLPVMKLIDMGYDDKENQFSEKIKDTSEEKEWYTMTQVCELILPLKFYQDESMDSMEMANLESIQAPEAYTEEERVTFEPEDVKIRGTRQPEELSVDADETKLLDSVKFNAKNRGRLYRKIVRNAISTVLSKGFTGHTQIMSMVKKLENSDRTKFFGDDEISERALKETNEFLEENEELDAEFQLASERIGTKKPKRFSWKGVKKVLKSIGRVIRWIVIILFFLGVFAALFMSG